MRAPLRDDTEEDKTDEGRARTGQCQHGRLKHRARFRCRIDFGTVAFEYFRHEIRVFWRI